jgi:hypothetical protein
MNLVQSSNYRAFPDLLPAIISNILDGQKENRYQLDAGAINVRFQNAEGHYAPRISHYGSIQMLSIVDKVREFLETFPLAQSLSQVKNERERSLLKGVLLQILSGTERMEHPFSGTKVLHVQITRASYRSFLNVKIEKKDLQGEEPEHEKKNEVDESSLTNFLEGFSRSDKLPNYFGISPK